MNNSPTEYSGGFQLQMSRRMALWLIAPPYITLAATAIMVLIHHLTGLPPG